MAEEYKNPSEELKNIPEHETPKVTATEESSATTGEVKGRGLFDFLGKKEEVKPQDTTTTTLESEFEHKAQVSDPPAFVAKHEKEEEKEHEPSLLEKLHQKHGEEEENKPSLLHKLHRSEEEGEDGEKRKEKTENKKIAEGHVKTDEDKKGPMDKIKEKLPGHSEKPEDSPVVDTGAAVPVKEETAEHPAEKKGILEKIKEKLPGHHAKSTGEEADKKEKETHA